MNTRTTPIPGSTSQRGQRAAGRGWVGTSAGAVVGGLVAIIGVVAGMRLMGLSIWPIELAYHFVPWLAVITTIIAVACGVCRAWRVAVIGGALAAHLAWVTVVPTGVSCDPVSPMPWAIPAAGTLHDRDAQRISVITYNIHFNSRPTSWLRQWFESVPADMVFLQEISPSVAAALADLDEAFPHRIVMPPLSDNDGIAILSTLPIESYRRFQPFPSAYPAIIARVAARDGQALWVVNLHGQNPFTRQGLQDRNRFFEALSDELTPLEGPMIVAGDFNATPYTPAFRHFLERSGVRRACFSPGTFPKSARHLGLPIDHVLTNGGRIEGLRGLRVIGSDHRGIRAEVALR